MSNHEPQMTPGTPVTYLLPQDSYGYVCVRSTATTAVLAEMPTPMALGHGPSRHDGPWPVWDHTYSAEEIAAVTQAGRGQRKATRRKDGTWQMVGGGRLALGRATYYRNHSY